MTHPDGSPSEQRAEIAPPTESSGRLQRTGYVALAASGLVLATAFAAIAQFADTQSSNDAGAPQTVQQKPGTPGTVLVPGNAMPGQGPLVSGAAEAGSLPPATPTTVTTTGPDGKPTITVITPPPPPPPPPGVPGELPPPGEPGPPVTWPPPDGTPPPPVSKPSETPPSTPSSNPPSTSPSTTPKSTTPSGGGTSTGGSPSESHPKHPNSTSQADMTVQGG